MLQSIQFKNQAEARIEEKQRLLPIFEYYFRMIADYPLIPDEAFMHMPQQENEIFEYPNGKKQRIIFGGAIEFDQAQKMKVKSLREEILKNQKYHRYDGFPDDFLLRFLQATSFNNKDCISALKQYDEWQRKTLPLQMTAKVQKMLVQASQITQKEGTVYFSGRDCYFRPIIVMNIKKILELKLNKNDLLESLGFFFQYVIENILIEGQVETWNTIIDLGKCSVLSLGGALTEIINYLSSIFRCRVHHNYLVNCPGGSKFLWNMVKKALNEDQIRKISLSEDQLLKPEELNGINEMQVEEIYGGQLPNLTQFWPIQNNPHPISVESTKVSLISVEEYDKLYVEGKLKDRKIKKCCVKKYHDKQKNSTAIQEDKRTESDHSQPEDQGMKFPIEQQPRKIQAIPLLISYSQMFM